MALLQSGVVPQGAVGPPYALVVSATPPPGVDGTLAVSALFYVRSSPTATPLVWSTTLSALATSNVTMTHNYVAADTATIADYEVSARITMQDGSTWYAKPVTLSVVDPFQI
jgi:hypothetical protein